MNLCRFIENVWHPRWGSLHWLTQIAWLVLFHYKLIVSQGAQRNRLWAGGGEVFRPPMTAAKFITKSSLFDLMPSFIRPAEQKLKLALSWKHLRPPHLPKTGCYGPSCQYRKRIINENTSNDVFNYVILHWSRSLVESFIGTKMSRIIVEAFKINLLLLEKYTLIYFTWDRKFR